jgi:hypothetical protein
MTPSHSDLTALTVWTTKPKSKLATRLVSMGIEVLPLEQDEDQAMAVERYQLSERAAVERRTDSAFLRGIQDKTLFTSAIYMRERYDVAALVVEGQTVAALLGSRARIAPTARCVGKRRKDAWHPGNGRACGLGSAITTQESAHLGPNRRPASAHRRPCAATQPQVAKRPVAKPALGNRTCHRAIT